MKQIALAQQFVRSLAIIEDNKQSSTPSFREIERDRKKPVCQILVPQRIFPDSILLDGVRQMPASIKEVEHLHAVRENFDLAVGRQNQPNVTSSKRSAVMCLVAPRA